MYFDNSQSIVDYFNDKILLIFKNTRFTINEFNIIEQIIRKIQGDFYLLFRNI